MFLPRKNRTPTRQGGPRRPIAARYVERESAPEGGGLEGFETPEAHLINNARLEHLASLGLAVDGKSVLDVGSGPGHLAQFFRSRGCRVVSSDARSENIARLKELYPDHEALTLDVERDAMEHLGRFDIVFCYGLLYHLENPALVMRKVADVCDDMVLLETMVCDSDIAVLRLEDEYLSLNQAMRGLAHRPSPSWVAMIFDRIGIHNVYMAAEPPAHPDYHFAWKGDFATEREGHLLRAIFVASRTPLANARLVPLISQA